MSWAGPQKEGQLIKLPSQEGPPGKDLALGEKGRHKGLTLLREEGDFNCTSHFRRLGKGKATPLPHGVQGPHWSNKMSVKQLNCI